MAQNPLSSASDYSLLRFEQLSVHQLYQILKLRSDVFVVEQNCVYPDLDDKDTAPDALHVFSQSDETCAQHKITAYARCLAPGVSYQGCSIGRVVVAPEQRGMGYAKALMLAAIKACQQQWPNYPIEIGAQLYLQDFYASLGFVVFSDAYDEDGIMHIDMRLDQVI
ncbi:GNAT family N-acetyltransferase [Alteromonas flava]|uniref:GNAT family N-acetyltransferase n=1 Tax=Alteromonas flava TaxID=2048003 RepID=UPI000C2943FF|nr:GNAT family N-acetyltransferase [Alteromonas flava]